jgi:Ca-activated chloride channel homolog
MTMRTISIASLYVAICVSNALAQTNNPPAKPAPPPAGASTARDSTADPGTRKLSRRERKELIAKLPDKYRTFLSETEPIMTPEELDAFLILESDAQRELYIEQFWRRRDRAQKTSNHAYRDLYYERLEDARSEFKQLSSDRARTYLIHGQPDDVVKVSMCDAMLQPIEIWKYQEIPGLGHQVRLLFYEPRYGVSTEYKLWNPLGGNDALKVLVSQQAVGAYRGEAEAVNAIFFSGESPTDTMTRLESRCQFGDEVLRAIGWMQNMQTDLGHIFEPPKINPEEVRTLLKSAVLTDPAAPKLAAEFAVAYPSKEGARTDAQMTLTIDKSQLKVKEVEDSATYNIDVTGEILKDGKLFENYRYRYDFPADERTGKLAVVIDRMLRPSDYQARIKIIDVNGGAQSVVEHDLVVPEINDSASTKAAKLAAGAVIQQMADQVASGAVRLRIVPLGEHIMAGIQHIETIAYGDDIKAVEFYLDGKKVMVKRQPPFTLDLDFGNVPQMRKIRAVGLDEKGQALTGDEIAVNTGTDPFRVRIVSPRVGVNLHGKTRVEVSASAPEGKSIESVQLFLNERRVATLYNAPYIQTVDIAPTTGVGYLRAVATLKDNAFPPIEDVVLLNTPDFMEQVDVHLVELPTTVVGLGGRIISDLPQTAFNVIDEGTPVKLTKFEYLRNLPLSIGMAVDTSGSMNISMEEAQKAGGEFFRKTLKPGDKSFLVSFDTTPQMIQKWTTKLGDLNAGLAKMRAEEATALYDAIVFSLYNFLGVRGQKALILITDGKDTASKFSFDQALEYARRTAVPIYAIAIGIKQTDMDVRSKINRFCAETGGNVYYIDKASDLHRIYGDVQSELRSQYLLGFYPPEGVKTGSKWHEVTVKVSSGKAKTIRGYYP